MFVAQARSLSRAEGRPWPLYVSHETFGVRVTVRATSAAHRDDILAALPPGQPTHSHSAPVLNYRIAWADDAEPVGPSQDHRLYFEESCVYRTEDPQDLLWMLQNEIEWRLAALADDFAFIHAGAIVYAGVGIVLPGVSGAGKSTLVSRFLNLGATYYSDEYAVLDAAGYLHPFPCLLKMKERPPANWRVSADEFGAPVGHERTRVALIVFPSYGEGCALRIDDLTQGQTALHLLQHMPATQDRPAAALAAATKVATLARGYSMKHGNSVEAAEHVARLVQHE